MKPFVLFCPLDYKRFLEYQVLNHYSEWLNMAQKIYLLVALVAISILLASGIVNAATAAYTVTNINTTVVLNQNTTAKVTEEITVHINNASVAQYTIDRSGLNLTLSNWQSIIGPQLIPHIINEKTGIYDFNLLPGPVTYNAIGNNDSAVLYMSYHVNNATFVNMTGPRRYLYRFNPTILNFAHGISGEVLAANTRFNIIIPNGSSIISVYPLPDYPTLVTQNMSNVTRLTWENAEPLYDFKLVFVLNTSLMSEVVAFFGSIYSALGVITYLIIGAAVVLLVIYTYLKTER